MLRGMLLVGLMLSTGSICLAQLLEDSLFCQQARQGLNHTYNADFDAAQVIFEALADSHPEHPAPHFLLATNRWWQTFICVTPHFHRYIDQQVQMALAKNERFLADSPWPQEYTLFQYLGHALHARLATHRFEWFTAANRGRKVIPYLDDCIAYADSNVEFCFAAGIYHYYAATFAQTNALVRPFMAFFPDGNVTKGLSELERAVAEPNFTQPEALYYLTYIYLEPAARDTVRAQQIAHQLWRAYPQNPWFACEYARVKVHTGFHADALPVLDALIERYEAQPGAAEQLISSLSSAYTTKLAMRAYHYRGLARLDGEQAYEQAKLDFEVSLRYAARCGIEEDHYVAAGWFYLGRCHEGLQQPARAQEAYRKAEEADAFGEFADRIE